MEDIILSLTDREADFALTLSEEDFWVWFEQRSQREMSKV